MTTKENIILWDTLALR